MASNETLLVWSGVIGFAAYTFLSANSFRIRDQQNRYKHAQKRVRRGAPIDFNKDDILTTRRFLLLEEAMKSGNYEEFALDDRDIFEDAPEV